MARKAWKPTGNIFIDAATIPPSRVKKIWLKSEEPTDLSRAFKAVMEALANAES